MGFVDFTKLLFAYVLTCGTIQSNEKYSRTRLRNAKPAEDGLEKKQPEKEQVR